MPFAIADFVKRNRAVAIARYRNLLDENRRVKGTDIWFDGYWRMHKGEFKEKLQQPAGEAAQP